MKIKLLLYLAFCAAISSLAQTVPPQINYQGVFADATGTTNLPDGNYTMSFSIYTDPTDPSPGSRVWGPQILQVPLFGGRCNVVLGPTDSNNSNIVAAFNGTNRFLGVSIGPTNSSTNIVPRQQILSAPYALKAANADKLAGVGWEAVFGAGATNPVSASLDGTRIQARSITSLQISNSAVANPQIAPGAVSGDKIQIPFLIQSNNVDWLLQVNNSGGPALSGVSTFTHGVFGRGPYAGVYGYSPVGPGVFAEGSPGLRATSPSGGNAADFVGNVTVSGNKAFRIDHPLDPANKYLLHSCVESPDMKNIYDGIAMLDNKGEVTVVLPAWFEALNKDFRYQLTAIGAAAPGLYIAEELANNRFKIAGGVSGLKVSWQVTGIRHDAWANAHRMAVEENKPASERGTYVAPEELGQPAEKGLRRKWQQDNSGARR